MKHEGTTLVRTQGFPKRTVSTGVGAVYVLGLTPMEKPWRDVCGWETEVAMNINI